MKPDFPICPFKRQDCLFEMRGGGSTLMNSPVVYNRNGEPVAGGLNKIQTRTICQSCGKTFLSNQTELEHAQGKAKTWTTA